jgi:hypothetical protein
MYKVTTAKPKAYKWFKEERMSKRTEKLQKRRGNPFN